MWTGCHLQLTLMCIPPCGEIGLEVHPDNDQFLRLEEGQGIVMMGACRERLNFQRPVCQDDAIFVPAGTWSIRGEHPSSSMLSMRRRTTRMGRFTAPKRKATPKEIRGLIKPGGPAVCRTQPAGPPGFARVIRLTKRRFTAWVSEAPIAEGNPLRALERAWVLEPLSR